MTEPRIPRLEPTDEHRVVYSLLDEDGIVIYVGCTTDLKKRVHGLKCARWWSDVAEVKARRYQREVAPLIERTLIEALRPLHNKAGVTTWYSPPDCDLSGRRAERVFLAWIFRLGLAGTFDTEDQAA